jgi:leukotriene-A4 hydrolase
MISHRRLLAGLISVLPLLFSPLVSAADTHSYAQPDKVQITALDLDLNVAMDKHVLSGHADLSLDWKDKSAHELVLDTRDLSIEQVDLLDAKNKASSLEFELSAADPILGSALHIAMPKQGAKVRITYHTSPNASGLQWLDALQTAGKKYAFLFSQSEAIHARSWVPLQDSPAVRFTYTAHIRTPKELRAAMSADNDINHPLDGDFKFNIAGDATIFLCYRQVFLMAAWKIRV